MKILHVFDHSIPLHSGYTFRSRAILEGQRKIGWQTFHLTSPKHNIAAGGVGMEPEEVDGLVFYRTPDNPGLLDRIPILNQYSIISRLRSRLRQLVHELSPDIIHAHSPALNGVAAVQVGKTEKIPVVYEVRAFWEDAAVDHGTSKEWGMRYRLTRAMETYVLRRASAITTICEGLRGDILSRGILPEKVTVIPNAVDISHFSMNRMPDGDLRDSLGLTGTVVFGFIGSFYAYEGLPLLLKAVKILIQRRQDVRVLLVGGGPQETLLKELAGSLGIENHIIFTGRVPHNQVQTYYDLVDVFVYPRISMRLTELVTPLKPLEAMAQGKLVVASDIGGHRELIEDGITGLLFPSNDEVALSKVLLDLAENEEKRKSFRTQARSYVENVRNWDVSVSRYKDVYSAVLAKSQL